MQHARGQARQPAQRPRIVQVAHQRPGALRTQPRHPPCAGGQRQHLHAASTRAGLHIAQHPLTYITTAHDQQAFAAKAGWQGAEGVLV